jgi:hypothetical protein
VKAPLPHRVWLNGLLAGLLVLAAVAAPALHGRAVVERATAHSTLHEGQGHAHADHGAPADGNRGHQAAPACFACVVMSAPGLPSAPRVEVARVGPAFAADFGARGTLPKREVARGPQRARAPPSGCMA